MRAIGATWLDEQLIDGGKRLGIQGFGDEVKKALEQQVEFLAGMGLAECRGPCVLLARNLLATLRDREVTEVARTIAAETGLSYRPMVDGQRVPVSTGAVWMLASGRYAILDEGWASASGRGSPFHSLRRPDL